MSITFEGDIPQNVEEAFAWAESLLPAIKGTRIIVNVADLNIGVAEPRTAGQTVNIAMDYRVITIDLEACQWVDEYPDKVSPVTFTIPRDGLFRTVLHEWVHASDRRPVWYGEERSGAAGVPPTFPFALRDEAQSVYQIIGGERESFAEAGYEFFSTKGETTNPVALWYAKTGEWKAGQPLPVIDDWPTTNCMDWVIDGLLSRAGIGA